MCGGLLCFGFHIGRSRCARLSCTSGLLEGVEQELASARIELANLINVPLVVDLKVVEPAETLATKVMTLPVDRLESVAIMQNADLRGALLRYTIFPDSTFDGCVGCPTDW